MSRDGATAGHDAAVTRSVYGHPAPFHPGIAEKASPAASGPTPLLAFGAGCGHAGRAELLIDCEEGQIRRAVLVGKLREAR